MGLQYYQNCIEVSLQKGVAHQEAKPMGFGPAAKTPGGPFFWLLNTFNPFVPFNIYACALVNAFGLVNTFLCINKAGGVQLSSLMHPDKIPLFRENATTIDETVLELDALPLRQARASISSSP